MNNKLFFELLKEARRLKNVLRWSWSARRGYLLGMLRAFSNHLEQISERETNMADPGAMDSYQDMMEG